MSDADFVWDAARWPNFSPDELRCKASGLLRFQPGFLDHLQELRTAWGKGMAVTSCCRSQEHNTAVGGSPTSLHICDTVVHPGQEGTMAIDVHVADVVEARALAVLALGKGWSVGVPSPAKRFLHLDRRDLVGLAPGLFGY